MSFYQTIAIEKEAFARDQSCFVLIVASTLHHSKRHTSCPEFDYVSIMLAIWRLMACIGITQMTVFGVHNSIETGNKHAIRDIGIEQIVAPTYYFGRGRLLQSS